MVVRRRTQKLARALPVSASPSLRSETALGDWYLNRLTVDRRPLLLLVSSGGLLPVLLPGRNVASLPERLPDVVAARLLRLGVRQSVVDAEVTSMRPVTVGATIDRSVVGIIVDFAKSIPYHLEPGAWDESTLASVEARSKRSLDLTGDVRLRMLRSRSYVTRPQLNSGVRPHYPFRSRGEFGE
jgi:hypothetical protein